MDVILFSPYFSINSPRVLYQHKKPNSEDEELISNYKNLGQRVKTSLALRQNGVRFLVCPECKHKSKREVTYEKHIQEHHGGVYGPVYLCN